MKRREYLKTACEDEVAKQFEFLTPMLRDLKSEFPAKPTVFGEVNNMTVDITINDVSVMAYLTNDEIEIFDHQVVLSDNAEKLIRIAIPYWLNQEIEEFKGILDNEPLNHNTLEGRQGCSADDVIFNDVSKRDEKTYDFPDGCASFAIDSAGVVIQIAHQGKHT